MPGLYEEEPMCLKQRFASKLLALALVSSITPHHSLAQESIGTHSAFGTSTSSPAFVPLETVQKIVQSEGEIDLGYPYFSEDQLRHIRHSFRYQLQAKERRALNGTLTEEDCFIHSWPREFESSYWPHEQSGRGERTTLLRMVCEAPLVLVAAIIDTKVGWVEGGLGTLVSVVLDETLSGVDQRNLSTLHFAHYEYVADVAGHHLCMVRPGFYSPAVGDTVLLLGRAGGLDMLGVANIFPVSNEAALPEPYEFIDMPNPVPLTSIRKALAACRAEGKGR